MSVSEVNTLVLNNIMPDAKNSNRGYSCECHIGLNFEGEGETCTRIGFDNVM